MNDGSIGNSIEKVDPFLSKGLIRKTMAGQKVLYQGTKSFVPKSRT